MKSLRNRIPENWHPGVGSGKPAPDFYARKYSGDYSAQNFRCVPADQRQCARGDAQAVRVCRVKQQAHAHASGICPCKYTHPPGAWSKAGARGYVLRIMPGKYSQCPKIFCCLMHVGTLWHSGTWYSGIVEIAGSKDNPFSFDRSSYSFTGDRMLLNSVSCLLLCPPSQ